MQVAGQVELSASLQNYVEAIYWISNSKKAARAKDIADRLNVGKSSVTGALQALAEKGLVNYAPYDVITLTDDGLALARELVRRHEVIRDFFVRVLSVAADEAEQAAGMMEHVVTDTILDRLIAFIEFVERCPQGGTAWITGFGYHCDNDACSGECDFCLDHAVPVRHRGQLVRPVQRQPALSEFGEGERLVLIDVDEASPVDARFREIGAQLGAVIVVERVEADRRSMQIKVKGYHETLTLADAAQVWVRPVKQQCSAPRRAASGTTDRATVRDEE
jgi:DtxR family Mn-dependent transcriptional regulator